MHIISASRRTDIPAFYGEWFMNRIREGYVCYANPFGGQLYEVSLRPEDVHAIVFWSKNYGPFLQYLDELKESGYDFYFQFSITGLPRDLEPHVPSSEVTVPMAWQLAERYSPNHVQWRYDPIVISSITDEDYHLRRFQELATQLRGVTRRCYFSFAIFYNKVQRNTQKLQQATEIICYDIDRDRKIALAQELAHIAAENEITMYSCCGDFLVLENIRKAHCVDGDLIYQLFPHKSREATPCPTREECGCTVSKDIGAYDTCIHGCVYCYANVNKAVAERRHHEQSVESNILGQAAVRTSTQQDARQPAQKTSDREKVSQSGKQLSLFEP